MTSLRSLRSVGALALTLVTTQFAFGVDWPQWQGPNRDAISAETGLLAEWPPAGPPLVWKAQGLGGGYSMTAIVAGRIYGMSYRDVDEVVWALDEKDGKEIWTTRIALAKKVDWGEGSRATPTVDGDRLYVLGVGGMLACLETATGKVQWQQDLAKDFGGQMPNWGFAESPLVDGDMVVCTPGGSGGTILALNKKTGATVWRTKDLKDTPCYSSIIKITIDGVPQYIQMTDQNVVGVASADGRVLWRAARRGRVAVIPTPIYQANHVYVTSGYGVGCNQFKITSENGNFKAEEVYANRNMVNHHGGVLRIGEYLYGHSDSGGWTCQEFKTGNVAWKNGGVGKGSVTYADGRLYMRSEGSKGTLALVEPTPDGYMEKGRFDQPDRSAKPSWPHPVIANGKLYLRDQGVLLCYDVKKK